MTFFGLSAASPAAGCWLPAAGREIHTESYHHHFSTICILETMAKRARLASPAAGSLAEFSEDDEELSESDGSDGDQEDPMGESSRSKESAVVINTSSSQANDSWEIDEHMHTCSCGKSFKGPLQLAGHKGRCDVYAQEKYGAPYARNVDAKNKQIRSNKATNMSIPSGMNLISVEPLSHDLMALGSSADATGGCDYNVYETDGDMGESRNNLYWHHKRGEACLWYGSDEVGGHDMIEVLPFFQKRGSDNDIIVKRADIIPLDGVFCQKYEDEHHRAFCLALLDFPEWDDNQRVSYVWSSMLIDTMNRADVFDSFRQILYSLGLGKEEIFGNDLEKMYLFALCALHSGFLEDCTAATLIRYVNDCNEGGGSVSDGSVTTPDIIELYRTILKFKDNQEKSFRRSASRCGYDFQVPNIPAEYPDRMKICLKQLQSKCSNNDEKETKTLLEAYRTDGLIHSAVDHEPLTAKVIQEYVEKVMAVPFVLPGCLVCVRLKSIDDHVDKGKQDSYGIATRIRFVNGGPVTESSTVERILDIFQDVDVLTPSQIRDRAKNIMLTIYDGKRSFSAPVEDVKICGKLVDVDTSLEILRSAKYDTKRAFLAMFEMYKKHIANPNGFIWNKTQFDSYLAASKAVKKDDAWKCYQHYKKNYWKKIANGDVSNYTDVELIGIEKEKPFKVIFDAYERMFHERPEQEDGSDEGVTHPSSSKTYMSQDSQDSQSSNIALPSPRQKKFSGLPSPTAKLKSPSTVPSNESDPNEDDEELDYMELDAEDTVIKEGSVEANGDNDHDKCKLEYISSGKDDVEDDDDDDSD